MNKVLMFVSPALGLAMLPPPALGQTTTAEVGPASEARAIATSSKENAAAIAYLQDTFHLTADEAADRVDREASAEDILERAAATVGEAWAGASIDHANGGTVYLHVTTEDAVKSLAAQQLPKWMVVELVPRSLSDLRRVREEFSQFVQSHLTSDLERMTPENAGVALEQLRKQGWRANIDVAINAVVISINSESKEVLTLAEEFARARAGESALPSTLVRSVDGLDLSATNDDCPTQTGGCVPLRGGVDLQKSDLTPWCTTGFTFARAGARFTSSADHCNPGQPWKHADQVIGDTVWQRTSPPVDAMMVRINDNGLWKASNMVWRPGNPDFRIVSQINSPDNSLQGITICHVGIGLRLNGFSAESCGPLTSIDGQNAPSWKNPSWDGLGVASYRQCSGDSGGPVFNGATGRAYGLVRGRTNAGGATCSVGGQNGVEAMFSWVSEVEVASGYDVLLSP